MTDSTLTNTATATDTRCGEASPGLLDTIARGAVLRRLSRLTQGRLTILDGCDFYDFGQRREESPIECTIEVRDPRFYGALAFGGSVGSGESYMNGWWEVNDLTALIRLFVRDREASVGLEGGLAWLSAPLRKLYHLSRRNTRDGSRRNISAHYDLGNDFYEAMLDETMMYSAAAFDEPTRTLAEAQRVKLDRLCRKLDLRPGERLLEIGTGWGGLAIHAARHYGAQVTTTTISREQHDYAAARIAREGLDGRVTLLLDDYRDLRGTYDKLVSVEMIEAVGHQYYDDFFARCASLLKPEGLALLQVITINDRHYEEAKRSVDFIQRYIFPGCCIPSLGALNASIAKTDLQVTHWEDDPQSYADTLRAWHERFRANEGRVKELGFDERFRRMWSFYLAYCEGGFAERQLGSVQMLMAKPFNRRPPVIAAL
jgi:cyclopropane-fatty-acyl-phospholipid synthase